MMDYLLGGVLGGAEANTKTNCGEQKCSHEPVVGQVLLLPQDRVSNLWMGKLKEVEQISQWLSCASHCQKQYPAASLSDPFISVNRGQVSQCFHFLLWHPISYPSYKLPGPLGSYHEF